MNACTIIARNYLPQARVLAESFLEHHPAGRFTALVVDDPEGSGSSGDGFSTISPFEIGIDRAEVHRMAMIYDVKELATAVKPYLLRRLLADSDHVVYFDPDIEVFAPLDDIAELAREHGIVLTPHITVPLPADGLLPDDVMILQAGTYNLGFIAVGVRGAAFLDWWAARLARDCLVAVDRGQFVDQRWIDLVPVLFRHTVLRDPSCNVAYWNLHERSVRWTGEGYEVDGRPLRFFHYSGYDPTKPDLLSVHLGEWPRMRLGDQPAVARLCRDYGRRLLEHDYRRQKALSYRYDALLGGMPIDARVRSLYREALVAAERSGAPEPPDPFDRTTADAFVDWLNEPIGPGGLSRYLYAVYLERPDIQGVFPLVGLVHRDGFFDWVETSGRHEARIPDQLRPAHLPRLEARIGSLLTRAGLGFEDRLRWAAGHVPPLAKLAPAYYGVRRTTSWLVRRPSRRVAPYPGALDLDVEQDPRAGLNVVGYLRAELGVGELGRRLLAGVEHSGIPAARITYRRTISRQEFPFDGGDSESAPYDTNLVCVNADEMPYFVDEVGVQFFSGRYTIGVWSWELETFPEVFHRALDLVDEVWAPSDFIRRALEPLSEKPVRTVPVPLEAPEVKGIERSSLGLPESFTFLFTFDFLSIFERKNPLGVVAAFTRAFSPGEATLVIKSINGDRKLAALEKLRAAAAQHPDINVMDGYLAREVKDGLMASCDCYVSLHRSEGLGFTLAEAMSYGKPVVATAYSGNLSFMDDNNSYLVPYAYAQVPVGCDPYPPGALWAEPDIGRAAELMRAVFEDRDEARRRGARARRDIRSHHSVEQTARFVTGRLEEIHGPSWLKASGAHARSLAASAT